MNDYNERSIWLRMRAMLSLNDPRWGRGDGNGNGERQRPNEPRRPQNGKDGEGPPDLDEMWRDFNRRLSRMFGRKGGGAGGGRSDNGRGARIGVGIVIGVLIAIYLGSGVFVVQDGQAAVVMQFGKYRYTAGQGVHWRLPYPFEAHDLVNIGQIRQVEVGRNNVVRLANVKDASMLTHDADIVDVRFAVQYQVKKPTDYLFRSADPDQSVMQAAQAAVRGIVGSRSTNDILYQDREAIRQQLVAAIQRSLDEYQSGLAVTGVTIQGVQAPDQVQAAFDDAAKVRQENERAKREAEAYAADLLPRAQADVARQIDEAKAYSDKTVAQAQGDAERFKQVYAQYSKAPAVIRERMYLETMQQIYSNTTKVFVDSKSGNNVLYLPLDKLVEQTRQRVADAAAASGATATPPAPGSAAAPSTAASAPAAVATPASQAGAGSDPLRSRDSFRSRTREDDVQ
ncbi:FtsH protease activity modulator HflK [Paraburkholderia sp. DD10]|uniref:Protein HflK n=1 Tax=Paraburkholderia terricola TaxID=169427 RepID=A0A1M6KWJ4_9BURK|nr:MULTISPECIES: FtsH protease activity modulator HflK [Paraburkholderia]ORC49016.1 HflK protein [Burkholderia sp. A27]AXE92035.1 FtsH protease activity modulator HflK [Paraburkholderia terricola]MDR6491160.1 membrane protease subunit HflK [Paraburkholderia terricola]SDN79796.1 protease FtsH subunit HflK [Paraburkholderia sediminicola]SHJ63345.1 protease FtsH subunit HflK [Paraburkholderia terricola]